MADHMQELVHVVSCKADADVWLKEETRPSKGFKHCWHVLRYVCNVLCVHHAAMKKHGKHTSGFC
jgi:hypothetical protein